MSSEPGFVLTDQARKEALRRWIRAIESIKVLDEKPNATLAGLFGEVAERHGPSPALLGEDESLSYRELAARSDRYARWALNQGFAAGDVICLLMPNCPDYVAIWFGLTQVGCVVALLNTHLTGDALAHCIRAARSTRLIVAGVLLRPALEAIGGIPVETQLWVHGETDVSHHQRIDQQIADLGGGGVDVRIARRPAAQDTALLIYTSGTTGLPKAAKVTQGRLVEWSFWFAGLMGADPSDRLYNCLPMYHSIGGVVAVGSMLVAGGSVVIRQRFSASRFWNDVVDGQCTIFQYIGELCRYLAHSAPDPRETQHRLRLCCGNGLRGDVWEVFQKRFEIPGILEYYASTEGNVSLYNCEGRPGAIGRVPPFLAHRFPVALIKCDEDTGAARRDEAGYCIKSEAEEAGEAIGQISGAAQKFDGYTDVKASSGKVLNDVFARGDQWYRTGDLMRKDRAGYYYFIDRLGDTFRWKGENVSTMEVAAVVSNCPGVTNAVVFGVAVPGYEGRAGMAAITTEAGFSREALRDQLVQNLPEYARPVFIRLCQSIEMTGTFKLKKNKVQRDGLETAPDLVWIYDRSRGDFVEFDAARRKQLAEGSLRL
jgi:fatty-acyl-CoA synthase